MGCCSLDMARKEEIVGENLLIYLACKPCGVKVNVRIYPISSGTAEVTEYSCPRCGNRKRANGRPEAVTLALVNLTSDWRAKK
jgi:hypothetical protein